GPRAAGVGPLGPAALLERLFARRARSQALAAAVATPLMLCACCAAPLFTGIYERTRKPAPALALALGAPSLNIAALTLTFILLGPTRGAARIVMAVVLSSGGVLLAARLATTAAPETLPMPAVESHDPSVGGFARSLVHVAVRTVPLIVLGVVVSSLLATELSPGVFEAM